MATCESIQMPSLSSRGGSECQNALHSISPCALAIGAKRVSPDDFQSTYSRLIHSDGSTTPPYESRTT